MEKAVVLVLTNLPSTADHFPETSSVHLQSSFVTSNAASTLILSKHETWGRARSHTSSPRRCSAITECWVFQLNHTSRTLCKDSEGKGSIVLQCFRVVLRPYGKTKYRTSNYRAFFTPLGKCKEALYFSVLCLKQLIEEGVVGIPA